MHGPPLRTSATIPCDYIFCPIELISIGHVDPDVHGFVIVIGRASAEMKLEPALVAFNGNRDLCVQNDGAGGKSSDRRYRSQHGAAVPGIRV